MRGPLRTTTASPVDHGVPKHTDRVGGIAHSRVTVQLRVTSDSGAEIALLKPTAHAVWWLAAGLSIRGWISGFHCARMAVRLNLLLRAKLDRSNHKYEHKQALRIGSPLVGSCDPLRVTAPRDPGNKTPASPESFLKTDLVAHHFKFPDWRYGRRIARPIAIDRRESARRSETGEPKI